MELAAAIAAALRELTSSAPVEVRENGGRITPLTDFSWEVRGEPSKPLLHLWSAQHKLTRRVLAIADSSEQRLALSVERFGRNRPHPLEFVRVEFQPSVRETSRAAFCQQFRRILAEQFPDEIVESLSTAPDLENSLSENYARGILARGSTRWAVLAVSPGESLSTTENSLTFALLWLAHCRKASRPVAGIRLMIPKGAVRVIAQRARALDTHLTLEIYEFDSAAESLTKVDPRTAGNIDARIVPRREAQALLDRAAPQIEAIVALAPNAISVHPTPLSREVWLRFRGMPFAYWDDARVFFGVARSRKELTASSLCDMKQLLNDLQNFRHASATDTRHPLYRAQPERWMESIAREDITRIDACLDARFVYAQVFATAAGEHGILDLLSVTREGRLAVIEFKATENMHLPLQAAGYWQQVRHHLERGDLSRNGYFPGIELQAAAPIVYLVAPALRFHPTTDEILRNLSHEMHVVRVGIDENWRRGLRVVMRQ